VGFSFLNSGKCFSTVCPAQPPVLDLLWYGHSSNNCFLRCQLLCTQKILFRTIKEQLNLFLL